MIPDPAGQKVSAAAVRALLDDLHRGPSQEAAAARLAVALWRRAVRSGDQSLANVATAEIEARLEALFDALAALERRGNELLRSPNADADASAGTADRD